MKLYNCTLEFVFYDIAEVYLIFFIKCTVVQFNFLHVEINISWVLYPFVLCLFNFSV